MGVTLEPYLSQFDVEKLEMASVMGICAGLVEPKSENVEKVLVFKAFLKGQGSHEESKAGCDQASRTVWEGVGGGQNRPFEDCGMPKSPFWRFLYAKMGHIDVEWHLQCISYRLASDPNGPISRIYSFFQ